MPDIGVTRNYVELKKADAAGKFYKVLEGSSGSGKTISIEQYLIEKALAKPRRIAAFRHDQRTCRDSIISDFEIVMRDHFNVWDQKCWNGTNYEYNFGNGSKLKFRGTQKPAKLHGPRQEISWGNEVMEMGYEAHRQLAIRTNEEIVYDFNPSLNSHWLFDKVQQRDDCAWIHSTFNDNPFLPTTDRLEILGYDPGNPENVRQGTADKWAWEVYGLGKRGRREGAIFDFFEVVDDWPRRMDFQKWGFGLDFGYSDDPTALIECGLFRNQLWLREWIYECNLITGISHERPNTPSIEGHMREADFSKDWKVKADSARPDQIATLVAAGFNVSACEKGAGSIVGGLDTMKRFPICVHRNSPNLQMELQQYAWKRHADGTWLNKPEDRWNHGIDGVRYWAMDELAGWQPGYRKRGSASKPGRKKKRY